MEKEKTEVIADLHIHSRFSRACSKDLNLQNLEKYARIKGIDILGTGDISHESWLRELKQGLEEKEKGIFVTKTGFKFVLSGEISLAYTQEKGRRVHLVYLAPDFEVNKQINDFLDKKGRRDYDGRPIFGFSCIEFVDEMMKISKDIEIIPAHCLLPDEIIHANNSIKRIKDMQEGEFVYTHTGKWKKVKKIITRSYSGNLYHIRPWYFSAGLKTTPEHPFYAIKSYKKCTWTKGLCKKGCSQEKVCKKKAFLNYKKEWIQAKNLEKGDFLAYPRFKEEQDIETIKLTDFITKFKMFNEKFLLPENSRNNRNPIKNIINVNKDFCLLIGYFLSEGYLIGDGVIAFSFNKKEKGYINEVCSLMNKVFGMSQFKIDGRRKNQADLIFQSNILNSFFRLFYDEDTKRAWNKSIPCFILLLSNEKLAEVFKGWWRGDFGTTVSRKLSNDMKQICLKLGIIPSIYIQSSERFNKNRHFIGNRQIISKRDFFIFNNLSFFEQDYGMLKEKCFKRSINKINRKHGFIDKDYVYLPVREIKIEEYGGNVYNLEVEEDNSYTSEFACVHNCWTPWFGIFGSESGFDSLSEAFKDKADRIHAIETGMSSSPDMNWRIKELNNKAIVSFSDAHSFWPWRIGREATIFKNNRDKEFSYNELIRQIRECDFASTIETDPAYGKYHYDGHRLCKFSCSPSKSKELNGICPVCGKPLTIGVENRVEHLASFPAGFMPRSAKPFYKILPLHELIALAKASTLASKKTWQTYNQLVEKFGNEFNILLRAEKPELASALPHDELLVRLIMDNRMGNINVKPGYDGEYGVPMLKERQAKLV